MLKQIAVEYVKKHRVDCIIILNDSFSDVIKPLVSKFRYRYFLFAATYCIEYLLNDLIKVYLFLHFGLCLLDNINESDVGGIEEVVRGFFLCYKTIAHTYIYQLKVISHYFWIFISETHKFFNQTFLLYMN